MRKKAGEPVAVVALGASAGGIEALKRFFGAMPVDSGLAFVVVLHLDPTHDSQMASVLASQTAMPVLEIVDGMRIEADRVYVIVPDRYLTVEGERLRLAKPTEARGHRYPVDMLFSSLAADRQQRAMAVVLSGTGSNGTHGLQDIRANGGLILVQDIATAKFDGMPRSAIAAGVADFVLAPEDMPAAIQAYMRHDYNSGPGRIEAQGETPSLAPVLALLRLQAGHDFSGYKENTLRRRIHRRMSLVDASTIADYLEVMRKKPDEVDTLVGDLMISVTSFFRDPEAWQALAESVIAPLFAGREADTQIRFWVPACSTGEEAYSLAMLAVECAEAASKQFDLKIFATDSQESNLKIARSGIYPKAATMAVEPARVERFFEKLDNSYQIKRQLREMVVFAPQNLLRDPPFSRLDLISCRNLLIYFEAEAQKRVLALMHFALRPNGYLFLGNAETVGQDGDLFETVSKKWRIYRRLGSSQLDVVDFPRLRPNERSGQAAATGAFGADEPLVQMGNLVRQELLARYAPASVLIDEKARVHYFFGSTGDYLEPPTGLPTRDLFAMVREGLRAQLRRAVRKASETREPVTFGTSIWRGPADRHVNVTVAPLGVAAAQASGAGLLLVSFQAAPEQPLAVGTPGRKARAEEPARSILEDELKSTRAELHDTVEQMEGAAEELKAANEEVTSMNEELQSTNEELETSKEELQSFNEELHTINNQLQHKVQALEDLTNDKDNLLASTEIATIFLDDALRVRWFSPASRALLELVSSDVGRSIRHFAPKYTDPELLHDIERVLKDLTRIEAEIRGEGGRWYLRRVLPYRTQDNRITGVVLTFTDITERKLAADAVNDGRLYSEAILETIRQPLLVLDARLHVQSANRAFHALFHIAPGETRDKLVYDLGNGEWDIPQLRELLDRPMPMDGIVDDFVLEHDFATIGRRTMLLNVRRMIREQGSGDFIVLAIEDITVRARAEAHRDMLVAELGHRVKNVLASVQAVASATLRQSTTLESFGKAFNGRLFALARAHDLLVDEGWAGADLEHLIDRTLEPYRSSERSQIVAKGPTVVLPPQAGVALNMIMHELATNAAKYGALSVPEGRLKISWLLDEGPQGPRVVLHWVESGGPPVTAPSTRGFGTRLIERGMSHDLQGTAKLRFDRRGLRCELAFPLGASKETTV